jgi:hypothetical protein
MTEHTGEDEKLPIRVENIMEQMKMNLIKGGQNKAIIVDVDGTIADHYDEEGVQMREHHDYGQVINDRPIWSIINLVKILHAEGFDILIITGRMDRPGVRRDTEAWLEKHNVPFDRLIMREDKDFSRDDEAKEALYDKHIKDKYEIEFVLDDRSRVVIMWRKLGLRVLQVAKGEF